jgi:hypothetical protein
MGGGNIHHTVKKPFANEEYGEGGIADEKCCKLTQRMPQIMLQQILLLSRI